MSESREEKCRTEKGNTMGEIRQEKSGFTAWTDRHAELWKFMKFLLAGGGSNMV